MTRPEIPPTKSEELRGLLDYLEDHRSQTGSLYGPAYADAALKLRTILDAPPEESRVVVPTVDELSSKRSNPEYVEVRRPEQILAQARQCAVDYLDAADVGNEYEAGIHMQNALDSYMDLDLYLSRDKTALTPADWQRGINE